MPYGPNFTRATLKDTPDGKKLVVEGLANRPAETIVKIVVVLRIESELDPVEFDQKKISATADPAIIWTIEVPAPEGLENGDRILCYGVETRRKFFRATTWTQELVVGARALVFENEA